jgi:predicted Rossmann fold flavoprotein
MPPKVGIVGGGAAGMMAAIWAARGGASVSLLEKNERLGRKILVSGNGRCNLTDETMERKNFHGEEAALAWPSLSAFDHLASRAFFAELGLETRIERFGRVYPVSNQAQSVVDVLRFEMEGLGVEVLTGWPVKAVIPGKGSFRVENRRGEIRNFDRLVVACGGCSYPQLGGSGEGYEWARSLGLKVEKPFPAIVALELEGSWFHKLQGVKTDLRLTLRSADGEALDSRLGELLFTSYGISGPVSMAISRQVLREFLRLNPGWQPASQAQTQPSQKARLRPVLLEANFFDRDSKAEVLEKLQGRWRSRPGKALGLSFVGLFHDKLAPVLLSKLGFSVRDLQRPVADLDPAERGKIASGLQSWPLEVAGCRPFSDAQGSAGGVSLAEIDPLTMESKKVPGLYFVGEVLDLDGDCGGYNMQWAWSSGVACGKAVAQL